VAFWSNAPKIEAVQISVFGFLYGCPEGGVGAGELLVVSRGDAVVVNGFGAVEDDKGGGQERVLVIGVEK